MNTNLVTLHILIGRSQIFHVLKVYEKCLESCGRVMLRCVIWELLLKIEGGRIGTECVLWGGLDVGGTKFYGSTT
jgi:hypothetical protein